jgi:hypothetical protein
MILLILGKKNVVQLMQLQKNIGNYLQYTLATEGYLVAEMVRTGKGRLLRYPLSLTITHPMQKARKPSKAKKLKTIVKRRLKFGESLQKGYTTIYNQCSQEVKDKLEATNDWEMTQQE